MAQPYTDNADAFAILGITPAPTPGSDGPHLARRCLECDKYSEPSDLRCANCGGSLGSVEMATEAPTRRNEFAATYEDSLSDASRTRYLFLAWRLGGLGVHNFYAHREPRGVAQIATSVFSQLCGAIGLGINFLPLVVIGGIGLVTMVAWVLVDMMTVTTDGDGAPFR